MNSNETRRGFLRKAATAGGCLMMPGLGQLARAAEMRVKATTPGGTNGPVTVIAQDISTDINPRAGTWTYITEILDRAGLFFEKTSPTGIPALLGRPNPIVLLAGNLRLTTPQREALAALVEKGGSVIGIGGTSGLDKLFGVSSGRPLAEGWIKVTAADHPITAGLRSSLHVFGGYAIKAASPATSLAAVEAGKQGARGSAIVENRVGQGRAILLAPDLIFSIVNIQQGLPVLQDGKPSPDDSAPINDGELKAEDGLVLDWNRDRTPMKPEGVPAFLEPISDELRELILRSVFHVAKQQGVVLPVLSYWPRGLKAVGHISHDSDGNDPNRAVALLEVTNRCKVKTTWCMQYPGGYPRDFYEKLKEQDYEVALHYDARTGGEKTSWSKENFLLQHAWLLKEAGLKHLTSNKNHYTRWEGRLDFLRWCEEVGINSDQTRGPSKKGGIGFPMGGSQPYFPLDDETESPRIIDVLEVNLMTQDLVITCPPEYGRQLTDAVLPHHGVAHFLFHPAHIQKPGVAEAFSALIDYGRAQGLEWWTSARIYEWEALRRSIEAKFDSRDAFTLRAAKPLREATLLFLKTSPKARTISVNGKPASCSKFNLHGFEFDAVAADVAGDLHVKIG